MDKYYQYLEELRDSGEINMWGAGAHLEAEFDLSRKEAKDVLLTWIRSFNKGGN
jgi:hypothetical protein